MNNQYQNQLNLQNNNQFQEMNQQNQIKQQNNNSKKKKYMYIAGPLLLLIALVGVTFAFFNYTRTGLANNIGTGRIYFNSTEGNTLYLTNMFPMASNEVAGANLDSITINIVGDTTYTNGQEFKISLVDVNNTIVSGSTEKRIPINYVATYVPTAVATGETPNNIGTNSDSYYTVRGSNTAVYKLNATGAVSEGEQVLVGYIPADVAVNGTLTIKAYLDGSNIAISDTYPSGDVTHTETSGETSVEVVDYTDGTTSEWVNGRTVLTTDEWNSLANTPISFKIRAESNEGIWVEEPAQGTIESCPGCKFMYLVDIPMYTTWNTNSQTPTLLTSGYSTNYNDIVTSSGKNYFLGVVTNASNQITDAYACGVKDDVPFCIKGTSNGSAYATNSSLLQSEELWNNTCVVVNQNSVEIGDYERTFCQRVSSSVLADTHSYGYSGVGFSSETGCAVYSNGTFGCVEGGGATS